MEYKGKLYGKVGGVYFPLEATTNDFEALEKRVEDKSRPDKAVKVLKKGYNWKPGSKPAWWVKFYGKRTRAEVGTLNLHMVGHFGNFRPIKRLGE